MSQNKNEIPISEQQKEAAIDQISKVLDANYVYPDKATKMIENLQNKKDQGQYANIASYDTFAEKVLEDLYSVVVDKHNRVLVNNEENRKYFDMQAQLEKMMSESTERVIGAPVKVVRKMSSPSQGPMKVMKPAGGGPQRKIIRGPMGQDERFETGIEKIDILEGNIGYITIRLFNSFQSPDGEKMLEALQSFVNTNAIIFDLRENRGGHGDMVSQIQDFVFGVEEGDDPLLILETYFRPQDDLIQRFAQPWTHGQSYRNKPVYCLISSKTGSAGEAFVFGLRNHKRATLIGETTAGLGHPTSFHKIDDNLLFMCSIGRTYDPLTDKGWEAVGVEPDFKVPQEDALKTAISMINQSQ